MADKSTSPGQVTYCTQNNFFNWYLFQMLFCYERRIPKITSEPCLLRVVYDIKSSNDHLFLFHLSLRWNMVITRWVIYWVSWTHWPLLKQIKMWRQNQDQFGDVKFLHMEINYFTEEGSFIAPQEHVLDHRFDQKVHPETGNSRHTFVKDIAIATFPWVKSEEVSWNSRCMDCSLCTRKKNQKTEV